MTESDPERKKDKQRQLGGLRMAKLERKKNSESKTEREQARLKDK